MSNSFRYRCPKCGSQDKIDIAAIVSVRRLTSNVNAATCDACGYFGTVKDFEPPASRPPCGDSPAAADFP